MKTNSWWIHPRPFVRNNIEYRLSSSASISKFKEAQTFILGQVAFNPYHTFSNIAKEILLLKYDVWYDYINELEQYILCHLSEPSDIIINEAVEMSNRRVVYYGETLADAFRRQEDIRYIAEWSQQHNRIYALFIKEVRKLEGQAPAIIFKNIVTLLTEIMNHTLYELQEIDIILYSDETPGLSFDNTCLRYINSYGKSLIVEKIQEFRKIRNFDSIIIKNYIDVDVEVFCTELKDYFKENGITYTII